MQVPLIAMAVLTVQPVMVVRLPSALATRSRISLATHVSTVPKVCHAPASNGTLRLHAHPDITRQTE